MDINQLKRVIGQSQKRRLRETLIVGGGILALWSCHKTHTGMEHNTVLPQLSHTTTQMDGADTIGPLDRTMWEKEIKNSLHTILAQLQVIIDASDQYISVKERCKNSFREYKNELYNTIQQQGCCAIICKIGPLLLIPAAYLFYSYYLFPKVLFPDPLFSTGTFLIPNLCVQPKQVWTSRNWAMFDLSRSYTEGAEHGWSNDTGLLERASSCPTHCFDHYVYEGHLAELDYDIKPCNNSLGESMLLQYYLSDDNYANAITQCQDFIADLGGNIIYHGFSKWDLATCFRIFNESMEKFITKQQWFRRTGVFFSSAATAGIVEGVLWLQGIGFYRIFRKRFTSSESAKIKHLLQNAREIQNNSSLCACLEETAVLLAKLLNRKRLRQYSHKVSEAPIHRTGLAESIETWQQHMQQARTFDGVDCNLYNKMEEISRDLNKLLTIIKSNRPVTYNTKHEIVTI